MRFCENCGQENINEALFCEACGTKLLTILNSADRSGMMGNSNVIAGDVSNTVNNSTTYINSDDSKTTVSCSICGKLLQKASGQLYRCSSCGEYVCNEHIDSNSHKCKNCINNDISDEQTNSFLPFEYEKLSNGKYVIKRLLDKSALDIKVPENVESISDHAFEESKVARVTLPEGLIAIKQAAFKNCKLLRQINLPNSLIFIEEEAFYGCEKLNITIPPNIDTGRDVIYGTITYFQEETKRHAEEEARRRATEEIRQAEEEAKRKAAEERRQAEEEARRRHQEKINHDFMIENGELKKYRGNDLEVLIPECVTSIGSRAFSPYSEIGKVVFPNNSKIEKVVIPKGVAIIGGLAFSGCTSLKKVIIPEGVIEIGSAAFNGCKNLVEVEIPSSVTEIGGSAFCGCKSLKHVAIPKNVIEINVDAFAYCTNLITIDMPECLSEIYHRAFSNCQSLKNIVIPKSVTRIGIYAFSDCNNLTSVIIPEGVTMIEEATFKNCVNLKDVTIPDSVTVIENEAFYGCVSLTHILLPCSITDICNDVFRNCPNVQIQYEGTKHSFKRKNSICSGISSVSCSDGNLLPKTRTIKEIIKKRKKTCLLKFIISLLLIIFCEVVVGFTSGLVPWAMGTAVVAIFIRWLHLVQFEPFLKYRKLRVYCSEYSEALGKYLEKLCNFIYFLMFPLPLINTILVFFVFQYLSLAIASGLVWVYIFVANLVWSRR